MKFGEVKVTEAAGAILAHTTRWETVTLKKGRQLSAQDCQQLTQAGFDKITVAHMEEGDAHEDKAAAWIAKSVVGARLDISEAHTGRCNLVAQADGLVRVNATFVNQLNAIDESVTIATLPDLGKADAGQIVATVKIIPFAVDAKVMAKVNEALAGLDGAVSLAPFHATSAVIINTDLPSLKDSVATKTTRLTTRRVEAVGSKVIDVLKCDHEQSSVARVIENALDQEPDVIIIVGASVTVDRLDVVPAGIVQAGGRIVHFGMPVDPGNLMLLADCSGIPVLVLPGCARSPKLNGIDWVLERLAAGVKTDTADIMTMGVGGLLVDSPVRPLPRDEAVRQKDESAGKHRIAVVILAAGQSRRMGATNKLLEQIDNTPLIRRTVQIAEASSADPVIVVTGHQAKEVSQALEGLSHSEVHNSDYAEGLSTSLKAGLSSLPNDIEGAIVCLGDMPDVSAKHLDALIGGFDPGAGRAIGVPVHNGKQGNPVLWARRFFGPMTDVRGDVGARHLIGDHEDLVYAVEFGDTAVLTDLDTPEAWARYRDSETA